MLKIKLRWSIKDTILGLFFCLQLLQNPLTRTIPLFAYVDECFALIGLLCVILRVSNTGRLRVAKENIQLLFLLFVFVMAGLAGNVLFQYQVLAGVLEDVYVNLKFFLNILTGYEIVRYCGKQRSSEKYLAFARVSALGLFLLTVLDLCFHLFPSPENRYSLRVVQLFFDYPTYLSAVAVFLIAFLTMQYSARNRIYILFSLFTLFFTLRAKALAAIVVYMLLFYYTVLQRKKIKVWHLMLLGVAAVIVAWEQFSYYYLDLGMESARNALTITSLKIMKDYFPIGTGFGTFASYVAGERYSPVYFQYGLSAIHGLTEGKVSFGSDTFWPIIIGQTGAMGTVCYIFILYILFRKVLRIRRENRFYYAAGVYLFTYLLIGSTSESAFCNASSMPCAFLLGWIFTSEPKNKGENQV